MRKIIALLLTTLVLAAPAWACVCECSCEDPTPIPVECPTPVPVPTMFPTAVPTVVPSATPTPLPTVTIPELTRWEENMKSWGARHCATLTSGASFDVRLDAQYYDAERIYLNIRDYTKDASWLDCAAAAEKVYRDEYVIPASGNVQGFRNFSKGLEMDFLRTGDAKSRDAIRLLATRMYCIEGSAYADNELPKIDLSRENAYCLSSYISNENVGYLSIARKARVVNWALGHLSQWFVNKTARFKRPFMAALTAEALIEYWEQTDDPRVIPALVNAADVLWAEYWVPSAEAFKYTDIDTRTLPPSDPAYNTGGTEPASDLNLLISPLYGFLWAQTGESRFRDRHDAVFAGGVRRGYLGGSKQYNQSYRWSIRGIEWRKSR